MSRNPATAEAWELARLGRPIEVGVEGVPFYRKLVEGEPTGEPVYQPGEHPAVMNAPISAFDPGDPANRRRNGDAHPELVFYSTLELVARVDDAPPVGFLCRPVWPADAYGVLAAEHKAGKTWAIVDLMVAVASGTPWLGVFPCERPGPVVAFLGEGGHRKMLRRLRAVSEARGIVGQAFEGLRVHTCFRSPHLGNTDHLSEILRKLDDVRPALVVLDPLYLAARGAKSSSLFDMGSHLEAIQTLVQQVDAALVVVHHWNQTGTGKGTERMSGAGPAEWGRVLVSVSVEHKSTDPMSRATSVTLGWSFVGDEIPDTELRLRRRVWAVDPDDLASPLRYEVEQLEPRERAATSEDGMTPATRRVLAVLRSAHVPLTVREIGDDLAKDSTGMPLKARTIQASLKALGDAGQAVFEVVDGRTQLWRAHRDVEEVEKCF
jgi:hypothetical protein